jgi:hypothetical protein
MLNKHRGWKKERAFQRKGKSCQALERNLARNGDIKQANALGQIPIILK